MGQLFFIVAAAIAAFPDFIPGLTAHKSAHRWVTASFVYVLSLGLIGAATFGITYVAPEAAIKGFFAVTAITVLSVPPLLMLPGPWPARFFCVWHGLLDLAMVIVLVMSLTDDSTRQESSNAVLILVVISCAVCSLIGMWRVVWPKAIV